jgi:hypothetical protein
MVDHVGSVRPSREESSVQLTRHRRDGFALAVAIGAIVVIGALIAGVFFASTQQYRIGRSTIMQTRAQTAAEYGLDALLDPLQTQSDARWNSVWNTNSSAPGLKGRVVFAYNGALDTVRVTKLSRTGFLVTSEGRVTSPNGAQARRRVGMLVTLLIPNVNVRGAVTIKGNIKYGGSAQISGKDSTLTGRNCPPVGATVPGVAVSPTTTIQCSGCGKNNVVGNPAVATDTMAGKDTTYTKFGDIDWATLSTLGKTPTGSAPMSSLNADGTCNTSDPNNWGDPLNPAAPCGNYFPIIYVDGDYQLSQGVGQGILLVQGNLKITGQLTFYGPVIVQGLLDDEGQATIVGGLMAAGLTGTNTITGNATVQYSTCALTNALQGSAKPAMAPHRPWVDLP